MLDILQWNIFPVGSWSYIPSLPFSPRSSLHATVINCELVIFGGDDYEYIPLGDAFKVHYNGKKTMNKPVNMHGCLSDIRFHATCAFFVTALYDCFYMNECHILLIVVMFAICRL